MHLWRVSSIVVWLGIALLGVAGLGYYTHSDPRASVRIEPADSQCLQVFSAESTAVSFLLHNRSRYTIRVVGFETC